MTKKLNKEQEKAATVPPGPLLIVAGAGTGKTRTLVSRLAYFIEQGVPAHKICAITFTNKAAREMADRISAATYDKRPTTNDKEKFPPVVSRRSSVVGPFIGTFHALGARILRQEAGLLGRKSTFGIFDDHDSFALVKRAVNFFLPKRRGEERADASTSTELGTSTSTELGTDKPTFFAQKISEIKNKTGALEMLKKSLSQKDILIVKVFEHYENALALNNAFDFDDLIEKPVALFKKHPEVLLEHQKKFSALLVDEYQDVSPAQYELVSSLAREHKNLSVVGDDEQLIYGWRYANLKTFFNFEKEWPGAQIAFLEENYRSSGNIIRAASAVVAHNKYRHPKTLWTKNAPGSLIKLFEANDESDEAEWVVGQIANSKEQIAKSPDKKNHLSLAIGPLPSTAILYRTNAQSRAIEQALIRHQIPYKIFGGLKFYERKEIKDIVAALRYFVNPLDSVSYERLEKNFSKRALGAVLEAFSGAAQKVLPVKLIESFLGATDYMDYIERNFGNFSERHENIAELLHFASQFKNLERFLEEIALVQQTDMPVDGNRRLATDKMTIDRRSSVKGQMSEVNLMTIHMAKGLEFDCVFIAGCSEGLLPHARSMDDDERLEEERRLMYVAMTRAKHDLVISFYDLPSRFLSEIPQELLELQNRDRESNAQAEDDDVSISLLE